MGAGQPEESPVREDVARSWYDIHYQQGLSGAEFSTTAPELDRSIYEGYGRQGYEAGVRARELEDQEAQFQEQFSMMMEGFAEPMFDFEGMQSDMLAQIEQQQAEYQAKLREMEIQQGQQNVRDMAEARNSAVAQAREFVSQYVADATSQAALTGSEIAFTDQEIRVLQENRFADIWSGEMERQYKNAAAAYGGPYSAADRHLARGTSGTFSDMGGLASMYDVSGERGTAMVGTPVTTALTEQEEEETLGRAATALG